MKVKYANFKIITRSRTISEIVCDYDICYKHGFELLKEVDISPKVRLLGIGVKKSYSEQPWGDAVQLRINFEEDTAL